MSRLKMLKEIIADAVAAADKGRRIRRKSRAHAVIAKVAGGRASSEQAGEGGLGDCKVMSPECSNLGVKDNLCGECVAVDGGGFELRNSGGLRCKPRTLNPKQRRAQVQTKNPKP